jgi:hypothetical protein
MHRIHFFLLISTLFAVQAWAQDDEPIAFEDHETLSLVEEGSLQSEFTPGYNFDYADIENPELQEDPLWNNETEVLEFDEPLPEE